MEMRPELKEEIAQRERVFNQIVEMLVVALQLECPPEEIDPDTPLFGTGFALDSVDAVEIIVSLETDFGISLDESDSKDSLRTINTLVDLVLNDGSSPVLAGETSAPLQTEAGYRAIRNSVALTQEAELRCLCLTGVGAFDALDTVCPCDLFLQDGQMKQTLLLDEQGIPFADVYVCREGENAYLLGDGPPATTIVAWIAHYATGIADFSIVDLSASHRSLALDGPYAWELCAEVFGSDVLGLPYLGVLVLGEVLVFRAGSTGEYGYHILVPEAEESAWIQRLLTAGEAFELAWADEAARAQCVLENGFFDIGREGGYGLTPLALQLQWRLSTEKIEYPGARAIRTHRRSKVHQRLTHFVTPEPVAADEEITCDGKLVGRILAAGYSPLRADYVGKALLDRPYWHAGLTAFRVDGRPIRTISPPAVSNLSLKVSPYRHSFHTRIEDLE